jgi:hypothetical protein
VSASVVLIADMYLYLQLGDIYLIQLLIKVGLSASDGTTPNTRQNAGLKGLLKAPVETSASRSGWLSYPFRNPDRMTAYQQIISRDPDSNRFLPMVELFPARLGAGS